MVPGQNKIVFVDITGCLRIVRECPALQFSDLQTLYKVFWDQIIELDPTMESNFFDLVEADPDLLKTALSITQLLGIDDSWLGVETLAALVYSYKDDEGIPHRGLLWEKYFESKTISKPDAELVTHEENFYSMIAALSLTEGSAEKALDLMGRLSMEELSNYLRKRAEILNKQETDPNNELEKRKRLKEM